ncbi:MAG: hypothetical protein K2J80_09135, partial [Oscillospiraceae bacterium]|nr:hypothetical protein [Oscillospiraceae bacterium]
MRKLSLNGFEMSSRLTFNLICFLAAVMHLTFLLLFWKFQVWVLMYINIGSVTMYVTGGLLSVCKDVRRYTSVGIAMIFSEIVLHAAACTLLQGVDTCFVL